MTWLDNWPKIDWTEYARAQGRIARWHERREHRAQGGKTLTLDELENLILRTQCEAMITESPVPLAVLLLKLEDMEREYELHAFLGETTTNWPANE